MVEGATGSATQADIFMHHYGVKEQGNVTPGQVLIIFTSHVVSATLYKIILSDQLDSDIHKAMNEFVQTENVKETFESLGFVFSCTISRVVHQTINVAFVSSTNSFLWVSCPLYVAARTPMGSCRARMC